MKKSLSMIALAVLTIGLLGSCSKINERLDNLDKRVDGIENERIASIDKQIENINSSISDLGTIRNNIQTLTATTAAQEEALKNAEKSLGERIDDLNKYVDDTLKGTTEWVRATFSTLEQYQATCDTIAKIDARLGNTSEKLSKDIKACSDSLTNWVNTRFKGYYTAAQMDAKVKELQAVIDTASGVSEAKADSIAKELTKTKISIDTAKAVITRQYTAAIASAITTSEGKLTKALQDSVAAVNDRIDALAGRVTTLETAVAILRGRVSDLERMIQSITFIPDYQDGNICVFYDDRKQIDSVTANFAVSPAKSLQGINFTKVSVLAKSVSTKSGVDTVEVGTGDAYAKDGVVSVKFKLGDKFVETILSDDKAIDLAFYFKAEGGLEFTTDFVGVTPRYRWRLYCDTYEEAVNSLLKGVYSYLNPVDDSYGKIQLLLGCATTVDVVCGGKDKIWNNEGWTSGAAPDKDLVDFCRHSYKAIENATNFIKAVDGNQNISIEKQKRLIAEAKALRGFFYFQLAETFGKIKIIKDFSDESRVNDILKREEPDGYADIWEYIINEFNEASEALPWTSVEGNTGCTKVMAWAYLAESYMWKAYRFPDSTKECYETAKKILQEIIASSDRQLNKSYSSLWDDVYMRPGLLGNKESIWQSTIESGMDNWATKVVYGDNAMNLTWELFNDFERGDKRKDASMCVGNIPYVDYTKYEMKDFAVTSWGVNPVCNQALGRYDTFFYQDGTDFLPAAWSLKYWRAHSSQNAPVTIYWMRYANVLLDYAECCFRLGMNDEGWRQIDEIRNRAFGNLEVGEQSRLTPYMIENGLTEYPIPYSNCAEEVTDAKTYYMAEVYKWNGGVEAWEHALYQERRKEFNAEPCLRGTLQRSGMLDYHINKDYRNYAIDHGQKAEKRSKDKDGGDLSYPWLYQGDFTYTGNYWKADGYMPLPELTYPF